ncbi:RagB/SusD family nutrient uptake outer membrane protein [Parabacteroides sp. FAFU027]|uniref:RagB/SusD family nutrient uptake outer membrane protein n=1 Tax=Parabacteroides sp. FAFU027 TaxID=2922715 RepID=UPI001FAF11D2|nr:RagB/SusD family nutrient uptake outer membrane protein [Parabacteroides sp. FAFU027]
MRKSIYSVLAIAIALTFSSCSDFFNPDTSEILLEKDYVGDYTELYSGYMGLAATVQDVADQASFLEGLRGDFLEPTPNAPREIWDVYNHQDTKGNTFASPKGYYNVIMNANDYLAHIFAYRKKDSTSISTSTFKGLVGGALRYKAWAYLQLAKIYGEAVYFDEPITAYGDINKYPLLKFDDVITKCVNLIETGMNGIDGKGDVTWSTELFPGQGQSPTSLSWDKICPPKECILAELYLYKNDFQKAKENCIALIKRGGENEASYQINLSEGSGDWKNFGSSYVRKEQICVQFYDYSLHQTNSYVDYYSNTYPNKYYLRPTTVGMNRFSTQLIAGIPNDKYRGSGVTFTQSNGDWVLYKFLRGNLTADKIYTNDVQICLYRAAEIHLFLVEALVGMGHFTEALAFLNKGVSSYYNSTTGKFNAPFTEYPTCLYRTSSTSDQANSGIRGRVGLDAVGTFALSSASALDTLVNMRRLDSLIVEESSLEFAGEGKAYFAMNRMARRWSANADRTWASQWTAKVGNPNPNNLWGKDVQSVWATKVGAKYTNGNGATIKSSLEASLDNWFIKYKVTE